ncbi:MAG: DsbA family protein [Nitrospira sp. SB0672_bin_25]|nr:DsbA family protein [Nitrospira sp. SB0672_bin_25]
MKLSSSSAYTSGRSNIAAGLGIAVLSLGLAIGAYAAPGVTDEDDRVRGNPRAPLTLLEYSDFTCGFCEKFFAETWPILFSEYIDTGKMRLVYRDFPRALSGPSVDTALAARCAGEQGQYWAMHDRLFSSSDKYSPAELRQQADALQLDAKKFTSCFEASRYTTQIFKDRIEGGQLGARGTPYFILYATENPQEAVVLPGAMPYEMFKEEIDKLLQTVSSPKVSSESL